jgi:hypothetical protein
MNISRNRRLGLTVQTGERIPFPYSPTPTACRAQPQTFVHDRGTRCYLVLSNVPAGQKGGAASGK